MTPSSDRCARSTELSCSSGDVLRRRYPQKRANFITRLLPSIFGILAICSCSSSGFAANFRTQRRSLVAATEGAGMLSTEDVSGSSLDGYASDATSKITKAAAPFLNHVFHNITAVRSTGAAYSARIHEGNSTNDDNVEFESQVAEQLEGATLRKYVFWGEPAEGGELNGTTEEEKHVAYFADLCGLSKAFIGIKDWDVQCIGDSNSCNGYEITNDSSLARRKVFCAKDFPLALIETKTKFPDNDEGSVLHIVGDKKYNLPADDSATDTTKEFLFHWRRIVAGDCLSLVAYDERAAILLQASLMLSWNESGGFIVQYVQKLVANKIGLAVILINQKVDTWGTNVQSSDIPAAIHDDSLPDTVADLVAFNQCFAAITTDGAVRTWGLGDSWYCNEMGAYNTPFFTSYMVVKEHLQHGVVRVVGNDKSFVAIKSEEYDNEVITWGHEEWGGSKIPPAGWEGRWDEEDIRWAVADTVVASDSAYTMLRQDKRVVSWGSTYTGAVWTALASGAKEIKASSDTFVVLTENEELVVFPGSMQGIYSLEADEQFKLDAVPKQLSSCVEGVVVVFGHDCIFSEWSDWSECTEECGGGLQQRTREIEEYPRNGECANLGETQTCNAHDCFVDEEEPDTNFFESTAFTVVAISGGAGILCVAGCVFVVRKRRQQEDYI